MIFGLSSIPGYDLPPPPSFLEYLQGFVQLDKFEQCAVKVVWFDFGHAEVDRLAARQRPD